MLKWILLFKETTKGNFLYLSAPQNATFHCTLLLNARTPQTQNETTKITVPR